MKKILASVALIIALSAPAFAQTAQPQTWEQMKDFPSRETHQSFDDLAADYKAAPTTASKQAVYAKIANRAAARKSAGKPIPAEVQNILDNPPKDIPQ